MAYKKHHFNNGFELIFLSVLIIRSLVLNRVVVEDGSLYISKKATIFFGIITHKGAAVRQKTVYDVWLKRLKPLGYDFVFCSDEKLDDYPSIKANREFYIEGDVFYEGKKRNWRANLNREMKRLSVAEYFIKHTNDDFVFITCDDVFLDTDKLNDWAFKLNMLYGTNSTIVLGDCIYQKRKDYLFLQGGSGYLLSRKAAEKFLEFGKYWVSTSETADDVEFSRFIDHIGLPFRKTASPYMFGHPISDFNISRLKKCPPNSAWNKECDVGLFPLSEVLIIHNSNIEEGYKSIMALKKYQEISDRLSWYRENYYVIICFDR